LSAVRLWRGVGNTHKKSGDAPSRPGNSLKVPVIQEALMTYLNTVYPDAIRLIDALGSLEAARGARSVVDHLQTLLDEQA